MPVQTISLPLTTSSLGHHRNDSTIGGSSARHLHVQRIKAAATFLRHGHLVSSFHQLKHHNKHVLVCNLPDEVARRLFLTCARLSLDDFCLNHESNACESESRGESRNSSRWSWVTVSHVCSSWRLQALDYALLWTYIDFTTPKHHSLTWGRAKTSPLHIIAPVTTHSLPLLHRTLQLAHRIKEVHLTFRSAGSVRALAEILAVNPNPAMESLIVDVGDPALTTENDNNFKNTDDNYHDPLLIPTAGPPLRRLSYMELKGAPFYLLSPRCTFLTHFLLHDLSTTERPPLHLFLSKLGQLTRLRHLTLDRAFPIDVDLDSEDRNHRYQSSSTSLKPISLPRIETITLVGSISEIAGILQWIILPSAARLIITVSTLSGVQEDAWKLMEALSFYSLARDSSLDALVLTGHEFGQRSGNDVQNFSGSRPMFRIRGFKRDISLSSQGHVGASIDITIRPEFDSTDSFINADFPHSEFKSNPIASSEAGIIVALNAIWRALALFRVQTLVLHDVDIITQRTWSHFLRALPSLRVLHITGRAPSGLVWALLLNAMSPSSASCPSPSRATSNTDRANTPPLVHNKKRRCDKGGSALVRDLKDIYLHDVDCSTGGFMVTPGVGTPINSHSDLDDSRFIDVLVAALRYRRLAFSSFGDGASRARVQGLSLRSISILRRCSFVPKKAVEDLKEAVPGLSVVCEFGREALIKEGESLADMARYTGCWVGPEDRSGGGVGDRALRHYHRLRTLLGSDSDFS